MRGQVQFPKRELEKIARSIPVLDKNVGMFPDIDYLIFKGNDSRAILFANNSEYKAPQYMNESLGIMYNHTYYTSYKYPYHIWNWFMSKNKVYLHIQFDYTKVRATITLDNFINADSKITLKDPYMLNMYNQMCCLGNIDYQVLGMPGEYQDYPNGPLYYSVWNEIMGRCFDTNHPYYFMYGAVNMAPCNVKWRCFRYFYQQYYECIEYNLLAKCYVPHPNDIMCYSMTDVKFNRKFVTYYQNHPTNFDNMKPSKKFLNTSLKNRTEMTLQNKLQYALKHNKEFVNQIYSLVGNQDNIKI